MPPSQLKIMFKTSDPASLDFVELTSAMLVGYTGKMKLEKYPIFDPSIKFNAELRKKIQDMTYNKKIEFFFNVKSYEYYINNSKKATNVKKGKTGTKTGTKIVQINRAEEKSKVDRDKADSNFEFMIQCIFCTGLPVANYYKTMEFYDTDQTARKITLKGTKSLFGVIMPSRFERCFSYLKTNGRTYTVTGLTWINDVLNHPIYIDILTKYKLYQTDVENVNSEKNDTELENKLNNMIIDIKDFQEIWKSDSINESKSNYDHNRYSSSSILESRKMREKLQTLFTLINNNKDHLLNIKSNDPTVQTFIKFAAIKKAMASKAMASKAQKNMPSTDDHTLKELIFLYTPTLKTSKETAALFQYVEEYEKNIDVIAAKAQIKGIITGNTEDEMRTYLRGTTYDPTFMKYFRTLQKLFKKDDMYNIIRNDLNYQDRNPAEIKEMDSLIQSELQNYYEYRKSLKDVEENREVSNIHWKKEAESINGVNDLTLEMEDDKPTESLFEIVAKCKELNSSCIDLKNSEYLDIGVEKINKRDKKMSTYEAYINLEVAEGVYNNENYQKLMCPYMSNVLGDAYLQMRKVEHKGENDVMRNRVFLKESQDEEVESKKGNNVQDNNDKVKDDNVIGNDDNVKGFNKVIGKVKGNNVIGNVKGNNVQANIKEGGRTKKRRKRSRSFTKYRK